LQDSIPICRNVFKHWIYDDAEYLKVWLTMLGRARYLKEPKKIMFEGTLAEVNYGEFIFGYNAWNKNTGVSVQRLRTLIKTLTTDGMILSTVRTNRFTIFQITNYEKFNSQSSQEVQGFEGITQQASNRQATGKQQASNSEPTTNEEGNKKVKKDKNNIYSADFEMFWSEYPKEGHQNSKPQSFKNFNNLIKNKIDSNSLIQSAKNYAADCKTLSKVDYLYKASNFIGQAEYYKSYLDEAWEPAQQELFTNKPKISKREQQFDDFERIFNDDTFNDKKTVNDVFGELPQLRR
jgi:hypothetical protein